QPPNVSTNGNQTITLPVNSVTLSGSASDPDGTIASLQWTQLSGPSQASIASPAAASTAVNNLVQGTYSFRLTATDNKGASSTSDLTVTVNAAMNQPPVAVAGPDQTFTLPQSSTILVGSGSDPDGTISGYQWSQVSGPTQLTFNNAASAMCTVSNFKKGVYVLRLTVKDDKGATAWANMTLTVLAPPNQLPVADAGPDQTITLPVNSVNLLGSASDPDGTIVSYNWTQTSGPTKTSFSSASPLALTVHNLTEGLYVFRLTATDNDGATTWDEVKVTVMPDPRTRSTATVYPNPATNTINIKIEALTLQNNSVLRIANAAGYLVYTENFTRTDFTMIKQVDISKLPNGTYFLSVTSDINTVTTIKFIKQ
ncbi:MAG: PKD domain-containing protein, partial [Flavisolibacter sp.]